MEFATVFSLVRSLLRCAWLSLPIAAVAFSPGVLAQRSRDAEDAVAGCAACSMILAIPAVLIGIFVLHIVLLIWVARDAKARGMDNSVVWMILVMVTGLLGLVIFLFSRPQGLVVSCPNCRNKRLQASLKCPHCGSA